MKKLIAPVLAAFLFTPVFADHVILDDLIVDGSTCVGFDCVNGESFGFDTIRLKENNLRIKFQDTSNSASFPTNDWQITANDSSNGGANKFSIDDVDGGRTPFTIEAGAPSHSLYVDDYGRVGFGTSVPVTELHTADGDTPTLRLEQDGSSGFTPQTWDVAGNETNFFVRDVTNGSLLPFRIRPGAPTSSIDVASSGNVGIANSSPTEKLHVLGNIKAEFSGADATTHLKTLMSLSSNNTDASRKSDAGLSLTNTREDFTWVFRTFETNSAFSISKNDSGAKEILMTGVDEAGGMVLTLGNGANNTGGIWYDASSRVLKENIKPLDTNDAIEAFRALEPVSYNYKTDKTEQVLGFIAEDVPSIVAINSRDALSSMDMVALLTKVVQEQDATITNMQSEINKLKLLQQKVAQIESILTNYAVDMSTIKKEEVSSNFK